VSVPLQEHTPPHPRIHQRQSGQLYVRVCHLCRFCGPPGSGHIGTWKPRETCRSLCSQCIASQSTSCCGLNRWCTKIMMLRTTMTKAILTHGNIPTLVDVWIIQEVCFCSLRFPRLLALEFLHVPISGYDCFPISSDFRWRS